MIQYVIRSLKDPRTQNEKYYPQVAPVDPMLMKDVAANIQARTTLTAADVRGCLDALDHAITKFIMQGKSVKVRGLGNFRPVISAKGVPESELSKCDATLIKKVRVVFQPDAQLKRDMQRVPIGAFVTASSVSTD